MANTEKIVNFSLPSSLGERVSLAENVLEQALTNRSLVLIDRFASAGRNIYTGPSPISVLRPQLAIASCPTWGIAQPTTAAYSESRSFRRTREGKERYIAELQRDFPKLFCSLRKSPAIIAWYATDEVQRILAKWGGKLLGASRKTHDLLEDKSRFNALLRGAGISTEFIIPSIRVPAERPLPSFTKLQREFGLPFVVQINSSGGRGTIFVNEETDYIRAAQLTGPRRVSRYIPGFSSNVTMLTLPSPGGGCEIYVDTPSHKAMHIAEVGIGPAKSGGNDWSLPFPQVPMRKFIEATVRIGEYAYRRYGLTGLWGLDSIWHENEVVINELNCRKQGTTEVAGVNQMLRGVPPLFAAHVAVHLGAPVTWLPPTEEFNTESLRRATTYGERAPFYLKVRNRTNAPVKPVTNFCGSGIYQITVADTLDWVRAGTHTIEANFDRGEILVANAPLPKTVCYPQTELCTLEGSTTKHHLFSGPQTLSETGMRLVRAIYKCFEPCEG